MRGNCKRGGLFFQKKTAAARRKKVLGATFPDFPPGPVREEKNMENLREILTPGCVRPDRGGSDPLAAAWIIS